MKESNEMIRDIPFVESDVVLIGVPYEGTVSGEKGTAKAPVQICNQIKMQVEEFDFLLRKRVCGDVKIVERHLNFVAEMDPKEMASEVFHAVGEALQLHKFPIVLGGEHTVSLGAIQAASAYFQNSLSVVQFDAHADMREDTGDYEDTPRQIAHSTVMRQAYKNIRQIIQIGIRSMSELEYDFLKSTGFINNVIPANFWGSSEDIIDKIICPNVYLTVDVDVFSGADFPGTGTFEPGGISWDKFMHIIQLLFSRKNVVGFDVVEVIPRENDTRTEYSAAKLVYNLIGRKFCK